MSDFTYHNLFETTGIEYILTIVFFMLLIPFRMLLNRKVSGKQTVAEMQGSLSLALSKIPKGIFFSKNHTWAFLEKAGLAKVGIDNLLTHLTRDTSIRYIKQAGDKVLKSEPIVQLEHQGKELEILAPVSGFVTAVNGAVATDHSILQNDPYGMGWMIKVKPTMWMEETKTFYMAEKAIAYLKDELARFKDFVVVSLQKNMDFNSQLVLQDGGELLDESISELPAETWIEFQKEFLNDLA